MYRNALAMESLNHASLITHYNCKAEMALVGALNEGLVSTKIVQLGISDQLAVVSSQYSQLPQ